MPGVFGKSCLELGSENAANHRFIRAGLSSIVTKSSFSWPERAIFHMKDEIILKINEAVAREIRHFTSKRHMLHVHVIRAPHSETL